MNPHRCLRLPGEGAGAGGLLAGSAKNKQEPGKHTPALVLTSASFV